MTNVLDCLQNYDLLAAYAANPQVFHCPGDVRLNLPVGQGWAYDSYAVPENVEAVEITPTARDDNSFTTMAAIKRPTGCAVMVEQSDPRGYNEGTFVISANTATPTIGFEDIFGIYHGDVGTFAFADGHAVAHKWLDSGVILDGLYSLKQGVGTQGEDYQNASGQTGVAPSQTGPDASFIYQSFESPTDP